MLQTLPGDDMRQIMWRFAERYDIQMAVQSARSVARGVIARLVADGQRNTHEWNDEKAKMVKAFDESGLTAAFLDPEYGGFIDGPKNIAMALISYEISWVDAGATTCFLAHDLGLSPILERGTKEQQDYYFPRSIPNPDRNEEPYRWAFCLTEPLPYVGVDTGVLSGRVTVKEMEDGKEPILHVEKRGRFISNMGYADHVTAAVDTGDERIKSSCMVILHKEDPGTYDHGTATKKLVQQLTSTSDPVFSLDIPASRIVGGYTIKDGVIIPNVPHGKVIEAVFGHTRIPVALMSAAKLLSSIEPIIRYQRGRFRGGNIGSEDSPRHQLGLQMKEDALQRVIDIWATGEAAASLGFAASRSYDEIDKLYHEKERICEEQGLTGRKLMVAMRNMEPDIKEYINLLAIKEEKRDARRFAELDGNVMVKQTYNEVIANVLTPAAKLWCTGYGTTMMREAVSMMGGYGITEDCPGFLCQKWVDAQLEATYEGPEVVQRRQLSVTMVNPVFLHQMRVWIRQLRKKATERAQSGACTLASGMTLWLWTIEHLQNSTDAAGNVLYKNNRQSVTFPMADALCWLLAARQLIDDVLELEKKGADNPALAEALPGILNFYYDLCHVQAARAVSEVGRITSELVYGYQLHKTWNDEDCQDCYTEAELAGMEAIVPGFGGEVEARSDARNAEGKPPKKAGPCPCFDFLAQFVQLRSKMDGCLTGSRLAKDRAANALTQIMIPEALDYPQ